MDSLTLLKRLYSLNLLKNKPAWWWPHAGHFEVVLGAVLTQNTRWENVEKALHHLKSAHILNNQDEDNLIRIAQAKNLEPYLYPAGFYKQKSARLILLAQHIVDDFQTFSQFQQKVTRTWLLNQKGIGLETADAILNYACFQPVLVCDSYTLKLLKRLNVRVQNYQDCQHFLTQIEESELKKMYPHFNCAQVWARYHGKIVEFSKLISKEDAFFSKILTGLEEK